MPKRLPRAKEKGKRAAAAEASAPVIPHKRIMATFYLSLQAFEKLDRVWLARRMRDRKAQKSLIIEELIMEALKEERILR